MRVTRTFIQVACSASLVVAASSCGSTNDDASEATDTTNTQVAVTEPTASAVPTTSAELAPAVPQLEPLEAGTTYRVGKAVLGRAMTYTPLAEGSYAFTGTGFFGTSLDDLGTELLVNVIDLEKARVFTNPLADVDALQSPSELDGATEPVPTDYLAYFAALPSVTTGTIETTELMGFPARAMKYSVGAIDGGVPCFGVDRGSCLLTIFLTLGVFQTYWDGDSGTLYEVTIDGRVVLVDVSDHVDAAGTAAAIVIGE